MRGMCIHARRGRGTYVERMRGMCAMRNAVIKQTRMEKKDTYPLVSLLLDAERPVLAPVAVVAYRDAGVGRPLRASFRLHRASPSRHCCSLSQERK